MAYFETETPTSASPVTASGTKAEIVRLMNWLRSNINRFTQDATRRPEDIIAASKRTETARRAVDNLLR